MADFSVHSFLIGLEENGVPDGLAGLRPKLSVFERPEQSEEVLAGVGAKQTSFDDFSRTRRPSAVLFPALTFLVRFCVKAKTNTILLVQPRYLFLLDTF